jgi:leader peptidase (prepilin peptidase)/N-methyltransferase
MIFYVWLVPLLLWLLLVGAAVGSFLNVCVYRIPLGKSLVWPASRCGRCFHEVRLKDNIPLVSYWALRGRCRDCGATFSVRYFGVELLTAVTFVALYFLEIGLNLPHLPSWPDGGFLALTWPRSLEHSWPLFVFHAVLACFLIVATGCFLDNGRVPAPVTATGTLVGLAGAVLFPWPFPEAPALVLTTAPHPLYLTVDGGTLARPLRGPMPREESWSDWPVSPRPGFYPCPVWGPLPDALPPGSWQLGLVTGLAGAIVGGWSLRLVALIMRQGAGRDFAAGAAGLTTMAGAFLGWQPILVAVLLILLVAVPLDLARRRVLAVFAVILAVVGTWLGWAWVGPLLRPALFSPSRLAIALTVLAALSMIYRFATTTRARNDKSARG